MKSERVREEEKLQKKKKRQREEETNSHQMIQKKTQNLPWRLDISSLKYTSLFSLSRAPRRVFRNRFDLRKATWESLK